MSKISGDRATNSEALAQLKDQFLQRERDHDARHKEDIQEIREAHKGELEKIKTDSEKRIQDMQEESSSKLNQKDVQYQKEIESIKAIYTKRLGAEGRKA
jgi:DNA anti-recombination protein RmuC